jgi:hypothetical protein
MHKIKQFMQKEILTEYSEKQIHSTPRLFSVILYYIKFIEQNM